MKKPIAVALCVAFSAAAVAQTITTNLPAQADVDVRSAPGTTSDTGYNRNVLVIATKNADPSLNLAAKAYIRFRLPSDFGTATSATLTMTRAIIGSFAWTYNVYGLNQGPISGSIWTTLTWPEVDGGNGGANGPSSNATTWNNAPGNVTNSTSAFSDCEALGTFTTKNAANGGVVGDQYSLTGNSLVNFLNEATNLYVTIMVSRTGVSSSLDQWASKENGTYTGPVLSLTYTPSTNAPAQIVSQPKVTSPNVYATLSPVLSADVTGTEPIAYQWRFNGTNLSDGLHISGANSNKLTLVNVTSGMSGDYSLLVANAFGQDISSNVTMTVTPATVFFRTGQMSNIWNLNTGDRPYLNKLNTERGMAYNPVTTNLLLVSSVSNTVSGWVAVIDAQTGEDKYYLDTSGVIPGVGTSSLALNLVGVGSDGAVYIAGQTINATNYPFHLYYWPDDNPWSTPTMVFFGDPGADTMPGLRWGDNFAVRGAGAQAQILLAPSTGTNVVLLRTLDGADFQNQIPPTTLAISGLPVDGASGFASRGIAFGPGTNTFWAKTFSNQLYLVEFDLNAQTGTVVHAYSSEQVPPTVVGIAADQSQQFLAGTSIDSMGNNVQLYDISDLAKGPQLRDQEFFSTQNASAFTAVSFGGDYLFALDGNNGIKAFIINTNWSPVSSFAISNIAAVNGSMVLSWASTAGHSYQVQGMSSLSGGTWSNLGDPMLATGSTLSFTNAVRDMTSTFYRVQGF